MIQSILTLIAALSLATIVSLVLLFLPAIIELKKPKDAGPRLIADSIEQMHSHNLKTVISDDAKDK
jgi:hypothetical protein